MAILNNPEDFVSGENVTAAKLNNLVDGATFLGGAGQATDDSTLEVNDGPGGDGSLRVKDLGITNAKLADASVTEAKIANEAVTSGKISTTDTNFNVQADGKVGIGTATPSSTLDVIGTINASDSSTCGVRNTVERKDVNGAWAAQPSLYLRLTPGTQSPTSGEDYGVVFSNSDGIAIHADTTDIDANTFIPHLLIYSPGTTGSPGRVGINTNSISAPFQVDSTEGGVLIPRMTTTEMNAISNAKNGEMLYNTTANKFYGRANGQWVALH